MSTSEADEAGRTAPIELPEQHEHDKQHEHHEQPSGPPAEQAPSQTPPRAPAQPQSDGGAALEEPLDAERHGALDPEPHRAAVAAASPADRGLEFSGVPVAYPPATVDANAIAPGSAVAGASEDVVYVPLAITIGDGFKFGCGFFLAFVLAALVAFVLLAALFLLTSLAGLNLPISR